MIGLGLSLGRGSPANAVRGLVDAQIARIEADGGTIWDESAFRTLADDCGRHWRQYKGIWLPGIASKVDEAGRISKIYNLTPEGALYDAVNPDAAKQQTLSDIAGGLDGIRVANFDSALGDGSGYRTQATPILPQPGWIMSIARVDLGQFYSGGVFVFDGSGDHRWLQCSLGTTRNSMTFQAGGGAHPNQTVSSPVGAYGLWSCKLDNSEVPASIIRRNKVQQGELWIANSRDGGGILKLGEDMDGKRVFHGPIVAHVFAPGITDTSALQLESSLAALFPSLS